MGPRKKQSQTQKQANARQRMQVARFRPDSVVQGSFNQSSGLLAERNRGSQCTCMSLMALVTAQQKPPNQWTRADLDGVLLEGDELYDSCRGERTFLLTTELPSTVSRVGQTYSMRYHNGFCGTLGRLLSDAPFYTLHDAIISAQRVSRVNFLLIGTASVSSACLLMNLGGQHGCYVFDSHSRNQHGMSGADGTSVLLKLSNLEMVSQYAQSLAASMKLGSHHQFEVVPCSLRLNSQTSNTPGFYAPLEQYVQQQEQQQQRYRESQQSSTTKTDNNSKAQRQQKWLSKPGVKEMRRERERDYRSKAEVDTARKLQRAEYGANPHVKQAKATRETVQRQEPVVRQARATRETIQRKEPVVRQARATRETEQRQEPVVRQARATRETIQRQELVVRQARATRETVQRKEPVARQARATRETVQRKEPVVKRARKIQREVHDKVPEVQQARATRETVQRKEPVVKRARKIQREVHDKVPEVQEARATRETVQRQEPVVKRARKIQREVHDKVPEVQEARATRETVQRQEPVVKQARTTREHNYNAMFGAKEKKKQQRKNKQDKEREMQKDIRTVLNNFKTKCAEMPKFTCCLCERFRFRSQVEKFKVDKYKTNLHTLEQCKIPCSDQTGDWICLPCHQSLRKDKVPVLSVHGNNLKPIEMPENLNELNTLEQFLITPVLPFMKIIALPKGSQQGMHGPVVCVAADIKKTVERLPRPIDDSGLIKVKLKRKLAYRGHHLHQQVRINLVADALHFLKQHHPTLKGNLSNILYFVIN